MRKNSITIAKANKGKLRGPAQNKAFEITVPVSARPPDEIDETFSLDKSFKPVQTQMAMKIDVKRPYPYRVARL